ncbi:hypothetical protein ACRDNQ_03725 [Palleronia sp. KMU-117]|uniref:hypothetical protein n=1 Tax=Palleronia sp. KMU-117 TaxID=3434108 RepID=UPI003D76033F
MPPTSIAAKIIRALDSATSAIDGFSAAIAEKSRELEAWNAREQEKQNALDELIRVIEEVQRKSPLRKAEMRNLSSRTDQPGVMKRIAALLIDIDNDNRRLDEAKLRYDTAKGESPVPPTTDELLWQKMLQESIVEAENLNRQLGGSLHDLSGPPSSRPSDR